MVRAVSDAKDKEDDAKAAKDDEKSTTSASAKDDAAETEAKAVEAKDKGADEAGDDEGEEDDGATPEAIARRVAALGEEDAIDRIAAEEERKLAERKAARKGKKKGGGLEVAASKKLEKIGKRAEPKRTVAVAADADPLIERTAKLSDWAKQNQKTVQLVGAIIAASLLGIAGWLWYDNKREVDASVLLAKAVADERARIGEPPKDDKEKEALEGVLMFKTFDERRDSAMKKYKEVQDSYPKTAAALLARLAEGSLLLDKREPDKAIAAYNDVKGSALASADQEVKGRVLEGLGFAHELKARLNEADKAKNLDEALKAYKELENTVDVRGFKELAMYHQARVLQDQGEADKAKEILLSVKERVTKLEDNPGNIPLGPAFPYLKEVAMDRLREIDPSAAPKQASSPGGSPKVDPAQMRKILEEMQKKQKAGGGDPHGH